MAIRPQPLIYNCPDCKWQKVYAPLSDTLMEMPPKSCPKCGNNKLTTSPASTINKMSTWLQNLLN